MRLLVTGGAGYVGSVCAAHLVDAGHEVVVLDESYSEYASDARYPNGLAAAVTAKLNAVYANDPAPARRRASPARRGRTPDLTFGPTPWRVREPRQTIPLLK